MFHSLDSMIVIVKVVSVLMFQCCTLLEFCFCFCLNRTFWKKFKKKRLKIKNVPKDNSSKMVKDCSPPPIIMRIISFKRMKKPLFSRFPFQGKDPTCPIPPTKKEKKKSFKFFFLFPFPPTKHPIECSVATNQRKFLVNCMRSTPRPAAVFVICL